MYVGLFCDCLLYSETVSVFKDGERLYCGIAGKIPSSVRYEPIWNVDTIQRKKYRTNQTNLYIFIKTEYWQEPRYL